MSSQSITNKLIANIKQTSNSTITTINSEKVICIDSSKNAIGINTLNPSHALTISGNIDNSFNAVKAPYLYITNSGEINELSTNFLFALDASINDLSSTNADFTFINGINADITNLDVSNITIKSNFLQVETISCDDLSVINLDVSIINCNTKGIFNDLSINGTLNAPEGFKLENADLSNISVDVSGDISFLICNTISAENISCGFLDVAQKLDVSFIDTNSMFILNDLSINRHLSVNGKAFFTTISANDIQIGLSGLTEFVENTTQNLFSGDNNEETVTFGTVNINNKLNMIGSTTEINLIQNTKIIQGDLRPTSLRIPTAPGPNQDSENYIYFDTTNTLYIGDISFGIKNNILYFNCDNDISGQRPEDFSFNKAENKYNILNYNNLIIEKPATLTQTKYGNYSDFKFIPLKFDESSPKFSTDSNKSYLEITTDNVNFELYANVSLKFYNKIPNDVELNNYIFGVCDISNSDHLYTSIQNSIMVFDNSFNYANSSINYYGKFNNNTNYPRLQFFVGSVKDNSFIYIDSLSVTIKF